MNTLQAYCTVSHCLAVQALFPGCDVARMVELAPGPLLLHAGDDWPASTGAQLEASATLLRRELKGADTDFMFQEDPMILLEPLPSLRVGLQRLRELWPDLSEAALGNSSPMHLTLALRALGLTGPPKGF